MNNRKLKSGIFIGIIILVIILFLLLLKSCAKDNFNPSTDAKQEEKEKEKAEIIQLINLYDLLERTDFCSKQWNEDAKKVVDEIVLLATSKENSLDKETAKLLQQVAMDLNELSKINSIENIDVLEKSLNQFEAIYGGEVDE